MMAKCGYCDSTDVSWEELHNFGQTDYLCEQCEAILVN